METKRIGLTYDLKSEYLAMGYSKEAIAEFDLEETVEAIESELSNLGHIPCRIGHAKELVAALARGERWDLVFNIAEGLDGIGREATVPCLLDLYNIPYTFSDPLVMSLTLHKGMAKRGIRDAGVPTAEFFVVETPEEAGRVPFAGPWFAKPVAEGTGKGISRDSVIRDRRTLKATCIRLLHEFRQPVIVEAFLPGREFTVGVLGTGDEAQVAGVMEVHIHDQDAGGIYAYDTKAHYEDKVRYRLADPASDPAARKAAEYSLVVWQTLGCRDAGRLDFRCDAEGTPCFMEINPLAGINPVDSDLPILCRLAGIPYRELIETILTSAMKRQQGKIKCAS